MMHPIAKFGRLKLLAAENAAETLALLSTSTSEAKDICRLTPFLEKLTTRFLFIIDHQKEIHCDEKAVNLLLQAAENKDTGIVYSDFYEKKGKYLVPHPLIDYQTGSIRDDFNFGHFFIFSAKAVQAAIRKYGPPPSDANIALYDLRLKVSLDYKIFHVPGFLYIVSDKKGNFFKDKKKATENHFDYTAARNLAVQKKLEKVATNYLKLAGAYLKPLTKKPLSTNDFFPVEASVIISVLNRKKTIKNAIQSALAQKTSFDFNIIVVDNHSSDGTTNIIRKLALKYKKIQHLIPERRDLGIGGCWNEAIYSAYCGRYAIQLDSDDLYSSSKTLQKTVDVLRKSNYALVVGSYTIVNEHLKRTTPGLIDHKEWTTTNGHNNLLRVNGLGAPRAFNTSIIRELGFPNVSYGEDYAVALRISREYQIGRIYKSIYFCRRWRENTDAVLSVEKQNHNDFYKDELRTTEIKARQILNKKLENKIFAEYPGKKQKFLATLCVNLLDEQKKSWSGLSHSYEQLANIRTRSIECGDSSIDLQFNPGRIVSSGAAVDEASIKNRPCFLCTSNLPAKQKGILYRHDYLILCNPAPIFAKHFTIVNLCHQPQAIAVSLISLMELARDLAPELIVFYNGPACGASAPDHLHFQAIPKNALPFLEILKEKSPVKTISGVNIYSTEKTDNAAVIIYGKNKMSLHKQFTRLTKITQDILQTNGEPMLNLLCTYENNTWRLIIFLRQKHRPDAFFYEGEKRIFVSLGAIDMAGVIITPMETDFHRLEAPAIRDIYREVSLPQEKIRQIMEEL